MSRKIEFHSNTLNAAKRAAARAQTVEELREAQAVIFRNFGLPNDEIAEGLGVSTATLGRILKRKSDQLAGVCGPPALTPASRNWGGRRNAHLTFEEEVEFLKPWKESSQSASVVILGPIRAALAKRLGKPVHMSVVWRLVTRHGWRKLAPDTDHPKGDSAAREAFKKKCPIWSPPP